MLLISSRNPRAYTSTGAAQWLHPGRRSELGPHARRHARRGTGPGTLEVQITLGWGHDAGRTVTVDHYDDLLRSCKTDPRRWHTRDRHGFAQYQPARRSQRLGRYVRSEERRVGKEGRSRWSPDH